MNDNKDPLDKIGSGVVVGNQELSEKAMRFMEEIAPQQTKNAEIAAKKFPGLVEKTVESRQALAVALEGITKDLDSFTSESDAYMTTLRQFNAGAVFELNRTLRELRDIRSFLLDPIHEEEMKKLSQFVELGERLAALKKSGVLDALVDTALKLG
jgi:hypothetical protein